MWLPTHPIEFGRDHLELKKKWVIQPPFFSVMLAHLGHSLVLAESQLLVSESSSHFFNHILVRAQMEG